MMNTGEPLFDSDPNTDTRGGSSPAVRALIQCLVDEQAYAVLCVQGGGQPYGALVAFAFSKDLRHAVFATPVTTRKYRLLSECDHVALVIDNRSGRAGELMEVEAVTATGRSQMIARGREFDQLAELLVSRHPYLKSFIRAETCALFRVDIVRFLHVARFQEVRQWIPTAHS
jgi:nitroimidazol reductase NimA-like FMN-containing flavoprotein (pyridoxamine 5'-phosphate oxidase superfamily)